MKTSRMFYLSLITILLTSCTQSFYQVYKVTPSEEIRFNDNLLVYEDDNCIVSYNLWSESGNVGFIIHNKTDVNIYLDMENSFFIINGIAHNYYKNRIISGSVSSGITSSSSPSASTNLLGYLIVNRSSAESEGLTSSSEYSISYHEEKIILVPPRASKLISEYSINESLIRNCNLFKYPSRRQINSSKYIKTDSPIVFSNRISYFIDDSDYTFGFENEFFVSEITNYPKGEVIGSKFQEFCGQKRKEKSDYFKIVSPDKFYIQYTKNLNDTWKH